MRRSLRTHAAHLDAPAAGARPSRAPLRPPVTASRGGVGNLQAQRTMAARAASPEPTARRLGTGHPLPAAQRRAFERFFATDLSRVLVHDGAPAAEAARALHARAFSQGSDIVFAKGAYRPDRTDGGRLLAHEIAHVVQHHASGDASTVHRAIEGTSACDGFATDQPTVRSGSMGPPVSEAQCKLNTVSEHLVIAGEERLPEAPLAVDAIFGLRTRAAVVAFQQRVFPVTPAQWDGIVGPKTWAALDDAASDPGAPPSFCPFRPGVETSAGDGNAAAGPTFAGGVPGFIPCQIKPSNLTVVPPRMKDLTVRVPGPVIGEASLAITPHLHLGVRMGTPGVNFSAKAIGGPGAGGEIFFSQVIRSSDRTVRVGKGSATDSFTDRLDGGQMYQFTVTRVGRGDNLISETDTPGQGDTRGKNAQNSRVSLHVKDAFDMFLMWRPDSSAPASSWLAYASVSWFWDARASGVTNNSQLPWLAPAEAFHVCGSTTGETSISFVNPIPPASATHLGLPVNAAGATVVKPLPNNLPDAVAKDKDIEKNC